MHDSNRDGISKFRLRPRHQHTGRVHHNVQDGTDIKGTQHNNHSNGSCTQVHQHPELPAPNSGRKSKTRAG